MQARIELRLSWKNPRYSSLQVLSPITVRNAEVEGSIPFDSIETACNADCKPFLVFVVNYRSHRAPRDVTRAAKHHAKRDDYGGSGS
jgi:hypothetical protein